MEHAMYDQSTIDLIDHLVEIRLMDKNSSDRFLHASEFEEILEALVENLPPPPNGIISRWRWSLVQRKSLFDYLQQIQLDVIETSPIPSNDKANII